MEILSRFNYSNLDHSKDTTPSLVLSFKAPTLDGVKKRPSLCVLPLVDVSGSMAGAKLDYAKKSLHKLVEHLQEGTDICGLVVFGSQSQVLVKPDTVTADLKVKLRAAIDKMRPSGGTNLSGGLSDAVNLIKDLDLSPSYLQRVIAFTDGDPTSGLTDREAIRSLLKNQIKDHSITVSAFGYGEGHRFGGIPSCDMDFLTKLSTDGRGNFAYVQDPDDALSAFGKELGGLLSTYATDLSVEIEPLASSSVLGPVTEIQTETDPVGSVSFTFPSILCEETRHFVFDVKCPESKKALPREVSLFKVTLTYSVMELSGEKTLKSLETKAKIRFVKPDDASTSPVREADEIVALHRMVKTQLEAEAHAKRGDYAKAENVMNNYAMMAFNGGYENIAYTARNIGARVGSNASYGASGGFLRSMSAGTRRGVGAASLDREAQAALESVGVALNTADTSAMIDDFTSLGTSADDKTP